MALKRTFRRKRASITSLIDVIFLLLLFFMLASTFSKYSEIELSSAPAGNSTTHDEPVYRLLISDQGLFLDARPLDQNQLVTRLSDLKDEGNRVSLAVTVSDGVTTQELVSTLSRIRHLQHLDVQVVSPS